MKIARLFLVFRQFFYLRSVLKRYNDSLLPGKYKLLPDMRSLVHDDTQSLEKASLYFDGKTRRKALLLIIAFLNKVGFFVNHSKTASGDYEAIYTANNSEKTREIKLFSFERKCVLTCCVDASAKEKALANYESFHKAYALPRVSAEENYPNAYKVTMISILPRPEETAALESIAVATMAANPFGGTGEWVSVADLVKIEFDEETQGLLFPLVRRIDAMTEFCIPRCPSHGDLSRVNLLYGEADGRTNFYWIDWEHLGSRLFFYDYFFYILITALGGDTSSFECYRRGEYDFHLAPFFRHFGVEYDCAKRDEYILIFALAFFKERVCAYGHVSTLRKFCKFLEEHGLIGR